MKRTLFLLILGLVLVQVPARGQEATMLTLQQAIEIGQQSSPAAEIARLSYDGWLWSYRSFRAQYMPALSMTGNAPGLQRSIEDIVQDDGSVRYVERNQTLGRFNLQVSQPIPMTGGQVFVSSGLSRLRNTFDEVDFTQWQSSPLVVGLSQPLFAFNPMKWTRRVEPMRFELARRTYVESLEVIALDVTARFFDVYIEQMNVGIAAANVAVNDSVFILAQGRFDIGTIAENDLLQSELALLNARSERSQAELAYQQALQNLKLALDLPYNAELTIVPPTSIPSVEIDADEAVTQALNHRPAFLDLEVQGVEADRDVAQARRSNSFSATLQATYGLNQSGGAFDDVYRDPLNQQQFSVNFQVPIFRWGRGKADVQQAIAERDRLDRDADVQRKELQQEVYFEVLQLRQLEQQVRIAAQADTVAARRFEVAKNRYLIGKIDITELFNAQREKDTASRSYYQILRQYWTAYFTIRRLTLYDFVRNVPLTGF